MRQVEGDAGRSRATLKDSKSPKIPRNASAANGNEQDTPSRPRGFGFCCFSFKEKTQINALTVKIAKREKKFGVDYLTMVEQKESQAALKKCLKSALSDVAKLQEKIDDRYHKIEPPKTAMNQRNFNGRDEMSSRSKSVVEGEKETDATASSKPNKRLTKHSPGEHPEKKVQADKESRNSTKRTVKKKKKKSDGEESQGEKYAMDEID